MSLFRILLAAVAAAATPVAAQAKPLKLDDGRVVIPRKDIGSVDLTRLPLGDDKISASPQRGSIWLCGKGPAAPPNQGTLPWVHGSTWNLEQKVFVQGSVSWPDARFANAIQGPTRLLSGNSLPVGRTTGVFPPAANTEAARYRPARGGIKADSYSFSLPASPTVAASPSCMGMEVGVSVDGVALYNGFDATYADAGAQEVQDDCDGHPNDFGYHRHLVATCLADPGKGQSHLLGYAFDGFGIYGHRGPHGKVMRDKDLDACHGITSMVRFGGKRVRMYHYVATWEFPYTVGCFRGTPIATHGPAFG
jgi:hypothetical protein